MKIASLFCLVATAFLLNACQQASTGGSNGTLAIQQEASDGGMAWQKRHCCRRAGRNSNK